MANTKTKTPSTAPNTSSSVWSICSVLSPLPRDGRVLLVRGHVMLFGRLRTDHLRVALYQWREMPTEDRWEETGEFGVAGELLYRKVKGAPVGDWSIAILGPSFGAEFQPLEWRELGPLDITGEPTGLAPAETEPTS